MSEKEAMRILPKSKGIQFFIHRRERSCCNTVGPNFRTVPEMGVSVLGLDVTNTASSVLLKIPLRIERRSNVHTTRSSDKDSAMLAW